MRPEEGMYLAYREGTPLLGFLPREHAHFGLRRKHRGLHGDGVRMRCDIARTDPAGRCRSASVRRRHGGRDACAEGRSEHVPVEGTQGAESPRDTPDTFLPPGASRLNFGTEEKPHTTAGSYCLAAVQRL